MYEKLREQKSGHQKISNEPRGRLGAERERILRRRCGRRRRRRQLCRRLPGFRRDLVTSGRGKLLALGAHPLAVGDRGDDQQHDAANQDLPMNHFLNFIQKRSTIL